MPRRRGSRSPAASFASARPAARRRPNSDNLVRRTFGGGHSAFVNYQFWNHAYCDGPYVASLARPKPVSRHRCSEKDADTYWQFYGGAHGGMPLSPVLGELPDQFRRRVSGRG